MVSDNGYGRYGFGSLFTQEGIMERKLSEEQRKRAALELTKASRNRKSSKKRPSRQPPPESPYVPEYPEDMGQIEGDSSYEWEIGQRVVALVANEDLLYKFGQAPVTPKTCIIKDISINEKAKSAIEGLLFLVEWTDPREKVHENWITNALCLGITSQNLGEDIDSHYSPEEDADQSYYEPESTIQGS